MNAVARCGTLHLRDRGRGGGAEDPCAHELHGEPAELSAQRDRRCFDLRHRGGAGWHPRRSGPQADGRYHDGAGRPRGHSEPGHGSRGVHGAYQLKIAPVVVTATYIALIGMLAVAGPLAFGLGGAKSPRTCSEAPTTLRRTTKTRSSRTCNWDAAAPSSARTRHR